MDIPLAKCLEHMKNWIIWWKEHDNKDEIQFHISLGLKTVHII